MIQTDPPVDHRRVTLGERGDTDEDGKGNRFSKLPQDLTDGERVKLRLELIHIGRLECRIVVLGLDVGCDVLRVVEDVLRHGVGRCRGSMWG